MEEELKQEDWEAQTTVNEIDIDEVLEDGGDVDEATEEPSSEGE